jgi:RND family efflux transporter MFP subunit
MSGEFSAPNGGFPKPGDAVRAGQVLGVVRAVAGSGDRIALAAARQAAAGDLAEAIANLALAERDLEQSSTLGEAISQRERESRAGAAEVARVALREAQRALDATGDGLSVAVRAPVDGRLGAMLGRPGNTVAAGDGLFRVVDAAGMWIEARVPEALAPEISPGSEAVVITTALPSTPLSALVVDAGQEANPSTGSVLVTLALTAQVPGLLPGMSVSAWLPQGPARKATVVPDAAVLDSGGRSIAFVKVAPEEFVLRELRLGKRSGELWAVEEGLAAGERVVVAGNYALRSLAGR